MFLSFAIALQEQQEIERRKLLYRGHRAPLQITGHTVVVVDDGLATGATMKVAIQTLREQCPCKIVIAVPVGTTNACEELKLLADEVICLVTPEPFQAVGHWYRNFPQLTDTDVLDYLAKTTNP